MSVTLEYALGITGCTLTGIAYASANGDAVGVALSFAENTNRLGYYSVTSTGLTAGENWIEIAGDVIDSLFATIPASGTIKILPGQNVVQYAGQTAQVGTDNLPKVSLWGILGTALTETGTGYIAAAFKKWFDVVTPTSTMNVVTTVTTTTTATNLTNAPTAGDLTSTMKNSVTAAVPSASANATSVWAAILTGSTSAGTLLVTVAGWISTAATNIRNALGMATSNLDTQLATIITDIGAISSGSGSGAYAVTITVNDGAVAIQNATVSLKINSSIYTATTNVSGVAVLSPTEGNGTYSVRIIAAGYQFTPTTLAVSGDTPHTYSMSALNITPSPAGYVTGWLIAYDENGDVSPGAQHTMTQVRVPSPGKGSSFVPKTKTVQADADGLVAFPKMFLGAQYNFSRDNGKTEKITASDDGGGTMALPNLLAGK